LAKIVFFVPYFQIIVLKETQIEERLIENLMTNWKISVRLNTHAIVQCTISLWISSLYILLFATFA